jgi:hypothetical protein
VTSSLWLAPARLFTLIFHVAGLERFFKPRFYGHLMMPGFNAELASRLPKYSQSISGVDNEPINIVLVGSEGDIKRTFDKAGWYLAGSASPFNVLYALFVSIIGKSYKKGPFSPLYINGNIQDFGFQKPTEENNFRLRHHLRVWQTGLTLPNDKPVWVVTASLDVKMRLSFAIPFIVHDIAADLDAERKFVVDSLVKAGATEFKSVALVEPVSAEAPTKNVFGSDYFTDGRAAVVRL